MAEAARAAVRLTTKLLPGLHVGGSWDPDPPDRGWDVVLTVCTTGEVLGSPPARHSASWPLFDAPWVDEEAVAVLRDATVEAVSAGAKTLVRCHLGLNRSALVAVLAAVELSGEEPSELVARLRQRRSWQVLHNEAFARYVLSS